MSENEKRQDTGSVLLDKNTLEEVMHEAIKNVLEEKKAEEELLDAESEDITTPDVDENLPTDENIDDNVDINVAEEVNDKVEELIDLSGEAELMGGIKVNVEKNDDGEYVMSLNSGDFDKTEVLDKNDLLTSFCSVITSFITDMPMEENAEKTEDEEKSNKDEEELDFDDVDNVTEEVEESQKVVESSINIDALRKKYAPKVNEIFEHGLEAKEIVLEAVRDSILANNIGELTNKTKEKSELIASKKTELDEVKTNYVIARKMNKRMNDVYNTLLSSVKNVEEDLSKGLISKKVAEKCLAKYNTIISKILVAKKPETLLASLTEIDKIHNALIASKEIKNVKPVLSSKVEELKEEEKEEVKAVLENKIEENQINDEEIKITKRPIISKRNVMNRDGMNDGTLSQRYGRSHDVIDEMAAEISRIAGI